MTLQTFPDALTGPNLRRALSAGSATGSDTEIHDIISRKG
jgi:hypothetical protein